MAATKHIPIRTCVGCRTKLAKVKMIRVVRQNGDIARDEKKNLAGRGQYLCSEDCYNKLKGRLTKSSAGKKL